MIAFGLCCCAASDVNFGLGVGACSRCDRVCDGERGALVGDLAGDEDESSVSSRRTSSASGAALFIEPDFEEQVDADSVALARESRPESASDNVVVADETLREAGESEPDASELEPDSKPEPEPEPDPDPEPALNVAASRMESGPSRSRRSRPPPADLSTALLPTGTMASGFVGGELDSAVNVLLLPLLPLLNEPGGCSSPSGVAAVDVGDNEDCECERRSSFCLRWLNARIASYDC